MGDKSPKAKQRDQNQKTATKTQNKNDAANRQAAKSPGGKDKKK